MCSLAKSMAITTIRNFQYQNLLNPTTTSNNISKYQNTKVDPTLAVCTFLGSYPLAFCLDHNPEPPPIEEEGQDVLKTEESIQATGGSTEAGEKPIRRYKKAARYLRRIWCDLIWPFIKSDVVVFIVIITVSTQINNYFTWRQSRSHVLAQR